MSFIEGIGDEVTAFFVVLVVLLLASLVTFIGHSTHLYSPVHSRSISNGISVPEPQQEQQPQQRIDNQNIRQENIETCGSSNVGPISDANDTEAIEELTEEGNEETTTDSDQTNPLNDLEEGETVVHEESSPPVTPSPGEIRIRLKYLDDTERTVLSRPTTNVADFKRIHFAEDLNNNKIVRLIFCGHLLRDNATLESYRLLDHSVVHVQILASQSNATQRTAVQSGDMDLSHLLWPLLSIILGICWIFFFKYPELFSLLSVGLLAFFTGSFVFIYNNHPNQ